MSWLSRVIHLINFSVIFHRTSCVVLNAALLLPPHETVVLQMLHVAAGLLSLSTLGYFHTGQFIHRIAGVTLHARLVLPQILL